MVLKNVGGEAWTWLGDKGDAKKLPAGNRREMTQRPRLIGEERPVISRGKCWSRQAGT